MNFAGGPGMTSEQVMVPDNMVGLIIGRGGEQITKLQEELAAERLSREVMDERKTKEIKSVESSISLDLTVEKRARKDLETNVNYRSKSGLLPSVDREARRLEDEERLLRQAEEELSAERISGELGASPRLGEGSGSTEKSTKPTIRATAKSAAIR